MREEKKVILKYKSIEVEDGVKEITTYISDDGLKKSFNKSDITQYESQKPFEKIETKIVSSNFFDLEKWYRLKNEEERKIFMDHYRFNDGNKYIENLEFNWEYVEYWELKLPLNEWFVVQYQDGGDSRDTYYIYTLDCVKKDLEAYLKNFELGAT